MGVLDIYGFEIFEVRIDGAIIKTPAPYEEKGKKSNIILMLTTHCFLYCLHLVCC